jgi:hypothetical protein
MDPDGQKHAEAIKALKAQASAAWKTRLEQAVARDGDK